jgi:2-keto-4-pentenoate hydratase/2-oxohepta-3-ene-1,7-dioic acid hydratase in catechol pathway
MTARNVQEAVKKKGLPWTTAKGFDTFCPVGYVHVRVCHLHRPSV